MKISKKFVMACIVMTAAICLKIFDKIGDLYYTVSVLSAFIFYTAIEGTLDLKALKFRVKTDKVDIDNVQRHDKDVK